MPTPASDLHAPIRFFFVRHGETDYNRSGVMQGGGVDSLLNATGRQQAKHLAERLREVPFDALYTSPLQRARETADILAEPHEPVPRVVLDDLREMGWGVLEGEPPSPEREAALRTVKSSWREGNFGRAVDGGESILDVQRRAKHAARQLVKHEPGATVLVVTHGRYLRVLLATVLDGHSLHDMPQFDHSNTGVNRLVYADGTFTAELLNDTTHLETANL